MSEPASTAVSANKQPKNKEQDSLSKQVRNVAHQLGVFVVGCVVTLFIVKAFRNKPEKGAAREKINWFEDVLGDHLDDALAVVGGFIAMCAAWFTSTKNRKVKKNDANEPKSNTPLDAAKAVEHDKEADELAQTEAQKFTGRIEQNKAATAASPPTPSR